MILVSKSIDSATKLLISGGAIKDAATGKTITSNGVTTVSSPSKFGDGGLGFNGAAYLDISPNTDFNFAAADFTVEFWANPTNTQNQSWIFAVYSSSPAVNLFLGHMSGGVYGGLYSTAGWHTLSGGAFATGQYSHLALARYGASLAIYLNGASISSTSVGANAMAFSSSATVRAGSRGDGGYPYTGYMGGLRVTKGFARYTGNFTPASRPW